MEPWFVPFDSEECRGVTGRVSRCSVTASSRTVSATATARSARASLTASALRHERVVSVLEESAAFAAAPSMPPSWRTAAGRRRSFVDGPSITPGGSEQRNFAARRMQVAEHFRSLMRARDGDPDDVATEDATPFPRGEFDELKKNFRAVQEENFKLQAVITDVTEVNKRWQKYNNDRQLYVQRLLSTIQDQQEQMNKIVQDRVIHSKEVCDKVGDSNAERQLETVLEERVELREEVARLTRQLEAMRQEHREHIEVLEFQLKAHRDDWEAERSEKQQALHDKDAAERKVRELQRDLRALKQKVREEKLQGCLHCKCCEAHVGELEPCNILIPGTKANICRKNHAKMYRTSVHVPCTSSPLLPRGTTIFFSDDLVVDGDKKDSVSDAEQSEDILKLNEDIEEKCTQSSENHQILEPKVETKDSNLVSVNERSELDRNNNSSFNELPGEFVGYRDSYSVCNFGDHNLSNDRREERIRKSSTAELNLGQDLPTCSQILASSTISVPTNLGKLGPPNAAEKDDASGVTIGFDNSGLASVMGFSRVPIAKSSSLPEKKELRREGVNPLVSRWSFDSYTALPIAGPPTANSFGTSMDSLILENKVKRTVVPLKDVPLPPSNQKPRAQKVKYSVDGVATQSEDDVICPGCGKIFPPKLHLKFLDHFEECQNKKDIKK